MDGKIIIKLLATVSLLNNDFAFSKDLITLLEGMNKSSDNLSKEGDHNSNFDDKLQVNDDFANRAVAIQLQILSDRTLKDSYGIKVNIDDNIEKIYQKIYVILYLKLIVTNPKLANEIFNHYNFDVVQLKQKILLTLIKGNNDWNDFSYFVNIANELLATGLDVNYTAETYEGIVTTPYNYAIMLKYNRIAQYLKDHGAKD